ncbi:hypothetical protein QJS10_CPA16g01060 [Acorus calamus]|uniref:RNase H type-1 domain-containing protein n=1 Tax=Acorus calamus TaxID=4465 RepID=A0AAV9D1R6_ACOCL|nr:hypothetical protein QJS10_CPA16g01060 [Acorus calamus]
MTPRARNLYLLRQPVIPNAQAKYWKQIWALPVYPKTASTKSDMESRELAASIIWGGLEKRPKSSTPIGAGNEGWPWGTPIKMEAEAIRIGIRFACTLSIKQIKICSDSLSLIQTFQVDGLGPPQIQEVVAEIQQDVHAGGSHVLSAEAKE